MRSTVRRARTLVAVICLALALLTFPSSASIASGAPNPKLADVASFALALGDASHDDSRLERLAAYDLVVLDGEGAPAELIATLQARGVLVLGYVSVGTIERGRPWTGELRPYRLDHWDDWDEWFADVADPGFRSVMTDDVVPTVLGRGFDGVFLDNVDMISSHRRQREGMLLLVEDIAELAHANGRLLFAQNGEDIIEPFIPFLDGWNREDVTGTYDFDTGQYVEQSERAVREAQAALRDLAEAGLLVTATDYFDRKDRAGAARATENACTAGALSFVSDIGLNRLPADPPRCNAP